MTLQLTAAFRNTDLLVGCGVGCPLYVAGITHCQTQNGGFVTTALNMTTLYTSKVAAEKESIESSANGVLFKPKSGEEVGKFTASGSKAGCQEEAKFTITGSFIESLSKASGETVFNVGVS